ncbi:Calcineurin subunit B type 2 [Glugoides intestinalis]
MLTDEKERLEFRKKVARMSKKDFFAIPEIKENPISVLLIKRFTVNEKIEMELLVDTLYQFTNGQNRLEILFKIYDSDGDEMLSSIELFEMLKSLNRGMLDDWKIQNIVDKTFAQVGEYKHMMNFEEFKILVLERNKDLLGSWIGDCNTK